MIFQTALRFGISFLCLIKGGQHTFNSSILVGETIVFIVHKVEQQKVTQIIISLQSQPET